MSVTSDRNDPDLNTPEGPGRQNKKYLVLSEEERLKGFVRPLRRSYIHVRINHPNGTCAAETRMGLELCETYARNPKFYGSTWCVACKDHLPVSEFVWAEDGEIVGS